jgi:branched-chain amino acid transport system permease protein
MNRPFFVIARKEMAAAFCVVVIFGLAGLLSRTNSMQMRLARIIIMSLYAISLNIQYGYGGMANLGSSLYFALSGYGTMLLILRFNWPLGAAIPMSLVCVLVSAFIFGYISLRRSMMTFTFLGMGFCILASQFAAKTSWTGGSTGLMAIINPGWMGNMTVRYFFILAVAFVCTVIIYLFTKSPIVATLKGARENQERLLFLGINVKKLRLIVFVITSFFMGVAGVLYVLLNNSVGTTTMDVSISLQALFMCIMGGASVFLGPVVGSVIVTLILTYVSSWTIYYNLVLGIIMLLCVYLMPEGILGKNRLTVFLRKNRVVLKPHKKEHQYE